MSGFNVVHYKIKQGMEDEFLETHSWMSPLHEDSDAQT